MKHSWICNAWNSTPKKRLFWSCFFFFPALLTWLSEKESNSFGKVAQNSLSNKPKLPVGVNPSHEHSCFPSTAQKVCSMATPCIRWFEYQKCKETLKLWCVFWIYASIFASEKEVWVETRYTSIKDFQSIHEDSVSFCQGTFCGTFVEIKPY